MRGRFMAALYGIWMETENSRKTFMPAQVCGSGARRDIFLSFIFGPSGSFPISPLL